MKLIKIRNKNYQDPAINWDFKAEEAEPKLSELLSSGVCGKPERWVPHKDEQVLFGKEEYDDADVLEEKLVEVLAGVFQKQVKLPAQYVVEIIDITAEHALKYCIQNRKMEYPSPEEFMNAFFDGGQAALDALQAKRLEVKAKYPKP